MIINPVLKGFNPDPSVCKKNNTYYIAVSTFEWFPGVRVFSSEDLENWRFEDSILKDTKQLNMYGVPDSGGVWAPNLSYQDGKFWLVYSIMKEHRAFKDVYNYVISANDISGEWSDPIFLNKTGFDPSMFHDIDGKKYILNILYDYRNYNPWYGGIVIQEYSETEKKLIGDSKIIYKGTNLGKTEGPNLFIKDGYYYLVVAEGGTKYEHAVTVARSKNLFGPYQVHPDNPILSSWADPSNYIQKSGHGDIFQVNDEWYMTYLMSRPIKRKGKALLEERGFCPLGRETSIAKIFWENDWPYVVGGSSPTRYVDSPNLVKKKYTDENSNWNGEFNNIEELPEEFQTLRVPFDEKMGSLTDRLGFLRLYGQESLYSVFNQSLVARRFESLNFSVTTEIEFNPKNFQQMAGLTCFYNTKNWITLYITHDDKYGKIIDFMSCDGQKLDWPLKEKIIIKNEDSIYLRALVTEKKIKYYYSENGLEWKSINYDYDTYKLSDDYIARPFASGVGSAFTGSFIGLHCNDLSGENISADFKHFMYREGE